MKKTRIYVCGAQSVGKTTLCRELGQHLGYQVVAEAARDIMNADKIDFNKIALDIRARDNFQIKVTKEHIARHKEAITRLESESNYSGFVFDRGIDFLVYAAGFSTRAYYLNCWSDVQEYIIALGKPESLVILLEPHESLLKQDDVRASLNMKSSYEVTFGIKVLLEVFGIPYIYITTPDTLERVKLVANIINT